MVITNDKFKAEIRTSFKPAIHKKHTISSISDDAMMIATVRHKHRSGSLGLASGNALRNGSKLCNNPVTAGSHSPGDSILARNCCKSIQFRELFRWYQIGIQGKKETDVRVRENEKILEWAEELRPSLVKKEDGDVRNDDAGIAELMLQALDEPTQTARNDGVNHDSGFIVEHNLRLRGECASHGHGALASCGQAGRKGVDHVFGADRANQPVDDLLPAKRRLRSGVPFPAKNL